jgi:hypothetical protein
VPKDDSVGLDYQQTIVKLKELLAEKKKVLDELAPYGTPMIDFPIKYIELSQKLNAINNQIVEIREWYNLGLTERLHKESVLMNRLTIGLVVLTAIFGILTTIDIISRLVH